MVSVFEIHNRELFRENSIMKLCAMNPSPAYWRYTANEVY